MNINDGTIIGVTGSPLQNNLVGVTEDEMTPKQKEERKVSLNDRRSILGKRLTQERRKRKIGRNDPCPCGSGFKFKKCCIDRRSNYI